MPATSSLFKRVSGIFVPPSLAMPAQSIPPTQASATPPQTPLVVTSPPEDLSLLEQVMSEVEQVAPQAVPTAMLQTVVAAQAAAQAAQPGGRSGNKEAPAGTSTPDAAAAAESGQSVQYVEYEPNPELPPEVEGYLNRVEQHADQVPNEIVIVDSIKALPVNHQLPAQPVVVLPITPTIEKAGAKKAPKFSIRWLVEWSHKIVKMFVGKVVYRAEPAGTE